ncbi:MAG: glycosyltransferase family 2 protein [Acidobacteria bacterium]|nr:glycosyltransferase family 2 protein [Acidobacteriota bacterium]
MIVAIIPALNEEGSIGQVVTAVPRDVVSQVIVVDNGSTDRTAEVARAAGATVVPQPERGYGAACHAGLMASAGADLLVYLDGDRSDVPEETPSILGPILGGQADLVIGSRLSGRREPGAMPPHAIFGNWLAGRVLRAIYGVQITDLGSFRAIRRKALLELGMRERTFGWPVEMIAKAARRGYRITEVPVSYRRRIGRSKVAGTAKGSLLAAYYIFATAFRYARWS